eukprot:SAG31_NODE_2090_length_6472_cov_4.683352_2_plen_209_part_00
MSPDALLCCFPVPGAGLYSFPVPSAEEDEAHLQKVYQMSNAEYTSYLERKTAMERLDEHALHSAIAQNREIADARERMRAAQDNFLQSVGAQDEDDEPPPPIPHWVPPDMVTEPPADEETKATAETYVREAQAAFGRFDFSMAADIVHEGLEHYPSNFDLARMRDQLDGTHQGEIRGPAEVGESAWREDDAMPQFGEVPTDDMFQRTR